jgi:hypothetical protein
VRANNGAPGVDRQDFEYIEKEIGVESFLAQLREELRVNTVGSMKGWRHSGFSVDTSVRIEGGDQAGMSRLVGYISRSPLSLARMVARTADGKIVYRASHPQCWPFPKSGEQT